jgi:hypothetical protein
MGLRRKLHPGDVMKKMRWTIALGVLIVASCGSSDSGGGSGSQIAQTSSDEFEAIMESCFSSSAAQSIEATKAVTPCNCPGGGTASLNSDTLVATMDGCKSSNGYTYTGGITFDMAAGDITIDFSTFGGCTDVSGEEIISSTDSCSGSIAGTCGDDHVECDFVADGDNCTLDC